MATLVQELQAAGFEVVVVSSCEARGELEWPEGIEVAPTTVVRKPNLGYDFGSWSIGLEAVPAAVEADQVLLINDSLAGPFEPIGPLLLDFVSTGADVWGLTDTYQFGHHLQSYCLGFTRGVLQERSLRDFWAEIPHEVDKTKIVLRNEVGLSRLLREEGYTQRPLFPHEHVVASGENPVIVGWHRLLLRGFPFVKREILRNPQVAPAGHLAPAVVRELYGHDVAEWTEEASS